jgi:hypothetical protein
MLSKKSPQKGCGIEIRNNRIRQVEFLNQCCASEIDLESILLGGTSKIFFRQYRPTRDIVPGKSELLFRQAGPVQSLEHWSGEASDWLRLCRQDRESCTVKPGHPQRSSSTAARASRVRPSLPGEADGRTARGASTTVNHLLGRFHLRQSWGDRYSPARFFGEWVTTLSSEPIPVPWEKGLDHGPDPQNPPSEGSGPLPPTGLCS